MSYDFDRNLSQRLEVTSAPVTSPPLTLCCWYQMRIIDVLYFSGAVTIGTQNGIDRYSLFLNSTAINVAAVAQSASAAAVARSSAGPTAANTWCHAAAVFSSTTSRTAYFNGENSGTNTDAVTVNTPNNTVIGARYSTSIGAFHYGLLAEVGVWSAVLTQPEIASLAKGMTCNLVRPQSLVFYAPLIRNLQDIKGGLTLTNNNTAT